MTTDTLARDIAALLFAVDAGDGESRPVLADAMNDWETLSAAALPALADALEELGSPRATGLRAVIALDTHPVPDQKAWHLRAHYYYWHTDRTWRREGPGGPAPKLLAEGVFERIDMGVAGYVFGACYETKLAAYLALAEALTPEE